MEHNARNEAKHTEPAQKASEKAAKKTWQSGQRLTPAQREEQILQVAAAHFAQHGVVAASMSSIAREAGITRALLYHYFPGKESLAAAVTRREARAVLEALSEHHPNPVEALRVELRSYFAHVAEGGSESDAPSTPDEYLEWMLERTEMPVNDRTRMILGGWLHLVDYFARHVVQGSPRGNTPAGARAMRVDEAIDICVGVADTMTGGY